MIEAVFDVEADGLLDEATVIHCLSMNVEGEKQTITKEDDIRYFFQQDYRFIGHNIIMYDLKVLDKLIGIRVPQTWELVDTLPLSWSLFPTRSRHGLEDWGETFGVPKPKITDWKNLTLKQYSHRCEEDVRINTLLWELERKKLERLYGS